MIWFGLAMAGVDFEVSPQVGVPTVVTVTDGARAARGETVRVIHNPGTATAHERAIGITDARGRTTWTPEHAGRFVLKAGRATQQGRIPWPSPPPETLILLLVLFFSACLGCGFGLRRRAHRV